MEEGLSGRVPGLKEGWWSRALTHDRFISF